MPKDSLKPSAFLTIQQLSEASGIPVPTLRRWVRSKRIPFYQPGGPGGRLLFPPDAIERTAAHHTAEADPTPSDRPCSGRIPTWMQQP